MLSFQPIVCTDRLALASNVDGALHPTEFVGRCAKAALVHVSTCYVVGARAGTIEERINQVLEQKRELFAAVFAETGAPSPSASE